MSQLERSTAPTIAGALLAWGMATTRDEAQRWARVAAERGATDWQIAAAWRSWDELTSGDVQTIGESHGAPCKCAHVHAGRCPVRSCGCTRLRPAVTA